MKRDCELESSIFDLDHAPEPPPDHRSLASSNSEPDQSPRRRSWPRRRHSRADSEDLPVSPAAGRSRRALFKGIPGHNVPFCQTLSPLSSAASFSSRDSNSIAHARRSDLSASKPVSPSDSSTEDKFPERHAANHEDTPADEISTHSLAGHTKSVDSILDKPVDQESWQGSINCGIDSCPREEDEYEDGADVDGSSIDENSDFFDDAVQGVMSFIWKLVSIFCCCKPPTRTHAAYWLARNAPCFLFCPRKIELTDRAILGRLNILISFFGTCQIASAMWLLIVIHAPDLVDRWVQYPKRFVYDDELGPTSSFAGDILASSWNLNISIYVIGGLAVILVVATVLVVGVIRNVNLVGCIRFLWTLLWLFPFELLCSIGLIDFFNVTEVWVKHWWREPSMGWFRSVFCYPKGTANTLCTVPILMSDNETHWCLHYYNSTSCTDIRDSAQTKTVAALLIYYSCSAAWGLGLIVIMLLTVHTLGRLVTKPLVQKSSQTSLPMWLLLPAVGCIWGGVTAAFTQSSVLKYDSFEKYTFMGPLYITTGILFFLGSMLGWYVWLKDIKKNRDKRQKVVAIAAFIITQMLSLILLLLLFASGISFAVHLLESGVDDKTRGQVACNINPGNCSRCQAESGRCPEWSEDDVLRILKAQARTSVVMSAVFLVFPIAALRFGFGLKRHVAMYQISYV